MARDTLTCEQRISGETLSAWRDTLLPDAEMRRVAAHAAECPACQRRLADFEDVARALHRQVELEPDERILAGVRTRIASRRSRWPRSPRTPLWSGLGALGSVAALLLLFVYLLNAGPGLRPPRIAATATSTIMLTPSVSATATDTGPTGVFSVADPAIAGELSFAFVRANDVWVSYHGAAPRQVTHFGLSNPNLTWHLYWTPDQSRLLADEVADLSSGSPSRAWIISEPAGTLQPVAAPLAEACGSGVPCEWLLDRYVIHVNLAQFGTHAQAYQFFDTQTQRDIPTALDGEYITEREVRGPEVYYTPYTVSDGNGQQRRIQRYDFASNTITTAFTVPGNLVSEGIPAGSFDVSRDGRSVISSFSMDVTANCPVSACHTYYQNTSGTTQAILSGQEIASAAVADPATISPDGQHAATTVAASPATILQQAAGYSVVQQGLPAGPVESNALPQTPGMQYWALGWTADSTGILIGQAQVDRQENTHPTAVYVAPAGSSGAAHLVETLPAGDALAFAPTNN